MKSEVTYQFLTPVPYAANGEEVEATFVTLKAPTTKQISGVAYLKQSFAIATAGDESEDNGDMSDDEREKAQAKAKENMEKAPGSMFLSTIAAAPDVDYEKVLLTAKALLISGVAFVEGEQKMTDPIMSKVTFEDLEGMAGEYIKNFIVASYLR